MRYDLPTFAGGEIAPPLYARIDTAKYSTAVKRARNCLVLRYGGLQRRPGTLQVGTIKGKTGTARLIPFRFSTSQAYVLEFTHLKMRVIKDGAYVLGPTALTITGVTKAAQGVVTLSAVTGLANGDEVYVAGVVGMTELNGRTFYVSDLSGSTCKLKDVNGAYVNTSGYGAYTSGGTLTEIYEITTPYTAAELFDIRYEQSADVMYLAHPLHAPYKIGRTAHNNWTMTFVVFGTKTTPPGAPTLTSTAGSKTYKYVLTVVDSDTLEESLASDIGTISSDPLNDSRWITVSWSSVSNAERYNVYRLRSGIYGFIGSTLKDSLTTLIDDNIGPDTTVSPAFSNRNPFDALGNYPSAVTFFEQRLCWANSENKSNGFWSSQSGNFENMNVSQPLRADDAITAALVARDVQAIQHLVPLEDLIAFTDTAVFVINGGGQTAYITPTSFVSRVAGYTGASKVRPVVAESVVLFWQSRGARLRSLNFTYEADGYRGNDLTVFAPHFFKRRTIVDQTYAPHPHPAVWAVGDDGALYVLSWMLEQEVWGWSKCETDGLVKSVCAIPQDGEDVVYLAVERTIGGVARTYVERLAVHEWDDLDDACFLDCALRYSGAATATFRGLEHLEGKTVDALADGAVHRNLTVAGGAVTLPEAASAVAIGLPYRTLIETLPPGFATAQGSLQGVTKSLDRVTLRVEDTRGLSYGLSEDDLFDLKDRDEDSAEDVYGSPPPLFTGDVEVLMPPDWSTNPTFVVVQDNPLPLTLNGAFPSLKVGG